MELNGTNTINGDLLNISESQNGTNISGKDPQCIIFRVIFYTFLHGVICILGVLGNSVSMYVLRKDRTNAVASFLLQALAVADNGVLINCFLVLPLTYGLFSIVLPEPHLSASMAYSVKYIQPWAYVFQTTSIYCTVLLAFNRYIAVCRPLQATSLCTLRKAIIQVLVVFTFAICFNFVRIFQYDIVETTGKSNMTILAVQQSKSIGENTSFGIYYTIMLYAVIVQFIPIVILIVLNTSLIKEIRRMNEERTSLSPNAQATDQNITIVMIIIVVILIVCHLPDRFLLLYRYLVYHGTPNCHSVITYLYGVTNFLVMLNSSVNFLVYYFCRKRFRKILMKHLCGKFVSKEVRISSSTCTDQQRNANGNAEMANLLNTTSRGNRSLLVSFKTQKSQKQKKVATTLLNDNYTAML